MTQIETEAELLARLSALGDVSESQRNSITCALIGHSRIKTHCLGYYSCARCKEQIGDSLAGAYNNADDVIVGHNCKSCQENYALCTWKDKAFVVDPFVAEAA